MIFFWIKHSFSRIIIDYFTIKHYIKKGLEMLRREVLKQKRETAFCLIRFHLKENATEKKASGSRCNTNFASFFIFYGNKIFFSFRP
jgi:hypothetical protein